ncbi:glucose-1-phosphate cytidylyltransferase [Granulicella arctica]|uniref:glucose-1-phosphate cytidylyltransferase n=1 Tax=Granulicella arctica TaxID=940613 RepID=UPI0021E0E1A7|nr:glucose-1-phosphate cytidylyltransferase [Granulicella arctica]
MKAVILAGGLGTRISEETSVRPKPMVEIGGRPILWHILKMYSQHGIFDFVICLGYKGYVIKEYFANYFLHTADVTFHMTDNRMEVHGNTTEPWHITLVETGAETGTGGRLKKVASHVANEDAFCMTYGDGVSDVNITESIKFHKSHGKLATLTAVQPVARFGMLGIEGDEIHTFQEKPSSDLGWLNGGFFVLSPKVLETIPDEPSTMWEREPLERIASEHNLHAYRHSGFWQPMDTLRDKQHLEELWNSGKAPWKTW